LEPVIRNVSNLMSEGDYSARMITLEDNPPTCTLSYRAIQPGETSPHHIYPWEQEVFTIESSGTLICDGKNYPVKAGDAIYIPSNVDHYMLNDGGEGVMLRIEINSLEVARSGGASNNGGQGTGEAPVIRNESELNRTVSHVLLNTEDALPNYVMLHNDPMEQEQLATLTPEDTHAWEHVVFVLEGSGTLVSNGKNYAVPKNDA
jgi:quercetin dioxygenase-like cupin family protein